ncbi:hypothetical protein F2Q69_00008008 [Brassica cretica]|uniref:Uncharacterized protein n=1 Tax=Brassica cretica TaxID=69181 RepID=A0A8S9P5H7_BRACR|nr:hypothetical protein F2Q69_00008008 [Brassica cretica]
MKIDDSTSSGDHRLRRRSSSEQREEERKPDGSGQDKEKEVSPAKPWNLRKRRAAACKEPVEERTVNPSPPRGGVVEEAETTTRPKFSVKLSKKEIEEDFMAAFGHRPPRRPKKRPRTVQKKLDVSNLIKKKKVNSLF